MAVGQARAIIGRSFRGAGVSDQKPETRSQKNVAAPATEGRWADTMAEGHPPTGCERSEATRDPTTAAGARGRSPRKKKNGTTVLRESNPPHSGDDDSSLMPGPLGQAR